MNSSESIAKLTEREKECLRLWLGHKTAKEIARELGVSHHAIEKRLKMARTKLGVGTSLEAARLLARKERYQQAVARSPDLLSKPPSSHASGQPTRTALGKRRRVMALSLALGLAMMVSTSQPTDPAQPQELMTTLEDALADALSAEVNRAREAFERLDCDGSGFIERAEYISPNTEIIFEQNRPPANGFHFEADEIHIAEFEEQGLPKVRLTLKNEDTRERRKIMFGLIDRNSDDRIEEDEFRIAHIDGIAPRTFEIDLHEDSG